MTGLAWAIAVLAIGYGAVVTLGGFKALARVDELTIQRDAARHAGAVQAVEAQEQAGAVQEACRIMRQLLEALPEDEKWQDVDDFLKAHDA